MDMDMDMDMIWYGPAQSTHMKYRKYFEEYELSWLMKKVKKT